MAGKGKVYLVGAGPGDVGLITVRGRECLGFADVVVFDNLVNEALLGFAPAHAEFVFAGKFPGRSVLAQDKINSLLAEYAEAGKTVVRLKGGDPFVFGRGGEEALHLARVKIPFEIVPGVSSAVAVPAYAGIPLTHRFVSAGFQVVTGHESPDDDDPAVDWPALARFDGTIVVLMGISKLEHITGELIRHGKAADTPAAVIRWGTTPEQETVTASLEAIADAVRKRNLGPPAVLVVGNVVDLRPAMKWVERRQLFGVRVAVTQPVGASGPVAGALAGAGADVVLTPTINVTARPRTGVIEREVNSVAAYDWIIFTSAYGVEVFFEHLWNLGYDARILAGCQIAAAGERTADALEARGVRPDKTPRVAVQEELARALRVERGDRVLVPCGSSSRDALRKSLEEREAKVKILPVYDTVPDRNGITMLRRHLTQGRVNAVVFSSAPAVEALSAYIKPEDLKKLFMDVMIVTAGRGTAEAVRRHGLEVSAEGAQGTVESLVGALVQQHRRRRRGRPADESHSGLRPPDRA